MNCQRCGYAAFASKIDPSFTHRRADAIIESDYEEDGYKVVL